MSSSAISLRGRAEVVDVLVGRIAAIEQRMAQLAGERAAALAALGDAATVGARELTQSDHPTRELRRRDAESLARRSVVADVAAATSNTEHAVSALLAEAQTLRVDLPDTLRALRDGRVTHRQTQVIVREASDLDADAKVELERRALLLVREGNNATLARRLRRERERLTSETAALRHARAVEHRNVRFEHVRDGMTWLTAYLPTAQAATIEDSLTMTALSHNLAGDERTLDQLQADALTAALLAPDCACTRTMTGDQMPVPTLLEAYRRVRTHVLLTVPALVLLGHERGPDGELLDPPMLEGVGPIDSETARQLCGSTTSFTRILTDPVTGTAITLDEKARVPSARLRTWLRYRDGVCRHPGCSRPAVRCDADHTRAYEDGGLTCSGNMGHLCRRHHRLKHTTAWSYAHGTGGRLTFTSATGRRHQSTPEHRVLRT